MENDNKCGYRIDTDVLPKLASARVGCTFNGQCPIIAEGFPIFIKRVDPNSLRSQHSGRSEVVVRSQVFLRRCPLYPVK